MQKKEIVVLITSILIISVVSVSFVSASLSSIIEDIGNFISGVKASQTYSVSNYQSEMVYSEISSGNLKLSDDYGSSAIISLSFDVNGKSISFSKIPGSKIEITPYLEGGEFTHKLVVPTDSLAKLPVLDFKAKYNIDCNQKLVYSDKIAYCGKIKIDFSTLEREYADIETSCTESEGVMEKDCKIVNYKIKPQAYDVSLVDGKIVASLKNKYKTETDSAKKLAVSDVLALDPIYTIYNLTQTSVLNDVVCENGGSYCHLGVNESDMILYMPFDTNGTELPYSPATPCTSNAYEWSNSNNDAVYYTFRGNASRCTTNHNTKWITNGKYGGAMALDGYTDIITVNNLKNGYPKKSLTVSVWVNFSGYGGKYGSWLVYNNNGVDAGYALYVLKNLTNVTGYIECKSPLYTYGFAYGKSKFQLGKWYMLTMTYNGTGLAVYVNGTYENSVAINCSIGETTYFPTLYIGDGSSSTSFNGSIDEVMIFNRSLSAAEISQIYNGQFARFKESGTQMMNKTIDSGYNRVNVTSLLYNQKNSTSDNTAMSLNIYDGTSWAGSQTVVNGTKQNYTISDSATSLNLSYTYTPDAPRFFSPVLIANITLETWNVASSGGSGNISNVSFIEPTPANGAKVDEASQIINVSIQGDMKELIWNWNGTNTTLYDSSLRIMYNFDNRSELGENDNYPVNVVGGTAQVTSNTAKYNSTGKYGGCWEFNSTALRINGTSLTGFNDLTVELWINREIPSFCGSDSVCSFVKLGTGTGTSQYAIGDSNAFPSICLIIQGEYDDQYTCVPEEAVEQNKWVHLVFIHDSSLDTDKIYVNGLLKYSETGKTEDPTGVSENFYIGDSYLKARMDNVKVWNRTLTIQEIQQEYVSNLYKYDSNKFVLGVRPVLDMGSYSYQASITNSSNSLFSTELRSLGVVSKNLAYIYGADGLAAKVNKNTNKIYAYVKDLSGNLRAVIDTDTKEVVWKQEYYMSGEPVYPQVEETLGLGGLKYDLVTGLLIGSDEKNPASGGGIGADQPCNGDCCLNPCPERGSGSYWT